MSTSCIYGKPYSNGAFQIESYRAHRRAIHACKSTLELLYLSAQISQHYIAWKKGADVRDYATLLHLMARKFRQLKAEELAAEREEC